VQSPALRSVAIAASALTIAGWAGGQTPSPSSAAAGAIRPEGIRAHMTFLSDDALEGRGIGTRGFAIAANYVSAQFAALGLEPGDKGQWFEQVHLRRRELDNASMRLSFSGARGAQEYSVDSDFVLTWPGPANSDLEGPVIFVGYGLTIPRRNYDDYARADVRGKIVAFLPGGPSELTVDERAYYEESKLRNAEAHGAIATLRIWTTGEAKSETWMSVVRSYAEAGIFTWGIESESGPMQRIEHVWLGPAASEKLFAGSTSTYLKALEQPIPGPLRVRARLTAKGHVTTLTTPNVVGLLRGSDSTLSDEYVVITAHLDHLGIGKAVRGDSIYNGAVDNASGVAALVELARAFATRHDRPRRSLLFVAFTGEEAGDMGSEYFVRHAPVPLGSIVANVNIDGISVWPFEGLVPRGAEHSTLLRDVQAGGAAAGTRILAEPVPNRYWLAGSDQYSFMKAGVPALMIGAGRSGAGLQAALAWVRTRYHQPCDDMMQPLDMEAAAQFARDLFHVIDAIAKSGERPRWNRGDFFSSLTLRQ
jgi:hypothetical protein